MDDSGQDQGNQQRDLSNGSPSPAQQDRCHIFETDRGEHYSFPLKKIVPFVLALPVSGIFIAAIVAYRSAVSTIDERIDERAAYAPLDPQNTIASKFSSMDVKLGVMDYQIDELLGLKGKVQAIIDEKNAPVRKKR